MGLAACARATMCASCARERTGRSAGSALAPLRAVHGRRWHAGVGCHRVYALCWFGRVHLAQMVAVRSERCHLARHPRRGQRDVVRAALQHDDGVVGCRKCGRPEGRCSAFDDVAQADSRGVAKRGGEDDLPRGNWPPGAVATQPLAHVQREAVGDRVAHNYQPPAGKAAPNIGGAPSAPPAASKRHPDARGAKRRCASTARAAVVVTAKAGGAFVCVHPPARWHESRVRLACAVVASFWPAAPRQHQRRPTGGAALHIVLVGAVARKTAAGNARRERSARCRSVPEINPPALLEVVWLAARVPSRSGVVE